MTIIHGFTSFNTIGPRFENRAFVNGDAGGPTKAAAADWSRWPAGTVFRLLSTGQSYRVEDYGWPLSGRNTIDLYMANQREMNSSCAREETIEILQWGDPQERVAFREGGPLVEKRCEDTSHSQLRDFSRGRTSCEMRTRFFWLVCILAMHAAIGLTMGMYLFALVMIVLNLAAFGVGIRVPWYPAGVTRHSAQFLPKQHLSP